MKRQVLRIPSVLAFAALGSASTTALVASCGDDGAPPISDAKLVDADVDSGFCPRACETMAGDAPCPSQPCIDQNGMCPEGCQPEPAKYYCVPDGTDAGVCPHPPPCILEGEMCPPGCNPVG